jgi:oxygen-dependent protoporphyrinogen oxidase
MSTPEVGATVVGAGIAGLAAALELQRRVSEVVLIDASDRPGGVMRTDHVAGYVIERGPNTLQLKAPMLAFLRRLGLEDALLKARPASRLRFLFRGGALVPVPMSPLAFARTPLLSVRGKLRLLAEPLIRRGDGAGETVAEFAGRRLGAEAVSGLLGPFLTGVYAGDENRLGAEAVFPALVDLERRHRSLAIGAMLRALGRRGERGRPGTWSAPQGLGPFARRLAGALAEPPALGTRVDSIARDGEGWRVETAGPGGGRALRTSRLVLATSAPEAAGLLRRVCPEAAEALGRIEHAPIVAIPFGVDPGAVRAPIEGFGFLVPRDAGLALLGCLFMSRLFPDRAPAGRELLHCMLGGTRWPEAVSLPDEDVVKRAQEGLDRTLGLSAEPQTLTVTRWPLGIPQPGKGHVALVADVRARLARDCPGLVLAGSYLDGVSVADTLASGVRAAGALLPESVTSPT